MNIDNEPIVPVQFEPGNLALHYLFQYMKVFSIARVQD